MKLLFDQNLSPRLVTRLADLYPDSQHVSFVSLDQADDRLLWEYANQNNFTVVTRDSDFSELIVLRGFPPKLVSLSFQSKISLQLTFDKDSLKNFSIFSKFSVVALDKGTEAFLIRFS